MCDIKYEQTLLTSSINERVCNSWTTTWDKHYMSIGKKKNQECIVYKKEKSLTLTSVPSARV